MIGAEISKNIQLQMRDVFMDTGREANVLLIDPASLCDLKAYLVPNVGTLCDPTVFGLRIIRTNSRGREVRVGYFLNG